MSSSPSRRASSAPARNASRVNPYRGNASRTSASQSRRSARPVSNASTSKARKGSGKNVLGSLRTAASRVQKPSLSSWRIRLAIAVVLVAIFGFVGYNVLFNSSVFAATEIVVNGSEHVSQETAEKLIDLPDNVTLFNVSDEQITKELKKSPWVKGVDIQREFPHKIIITPTERTVSAVVYIAADDVAWAIGDDGAWIAPVSLSVYVDADGNQVDASAAVTSSDASADTSEDVASDGGASSDVTTEDTSSDASDADSTDADTTADGSSDTTSSTTAALADGVTQLTGEDAARVVASNLKAALFTNVGTDISPSSGSAVTSEALLAGLKYVSGFSSDFLAQIKSFSLPSVASISCNLTNGVEVSLGDADDISKKERVVTKLLEQVEGVTYINVRTPDAYTYRAASL